ncbi:hypothetical protein CRG98_012142 [Punica granatum]|uniref:Uncharacterized protein n=1 Tax=Punica granatum TaxID=22663 RepID=A0A2I0KGF5_PUNGR|nr:hypothetical protein CRG98_012142 [Punica granatum]
MITGDSFSHVCPSRVPTGRWTVPSRAIQKRAMRAPTRVHIRVCTPLDLAPLPANSRVCLDGKKWVEQIKALLEQVKKQIKKKNAAYAQGANKGRKQVHFNPGNFVWIHLRTNDHHGHLEGSLGYPRPPTLPQNSIQSLRGDIRPDLCQLGLSSIPVGSVWCHSGLFNGKQPQPDPSTVQPDS